MACKADCGLCELSFGGVKCDLFFFATLEELTDVMCVFSNIVVIEDDVIYDSSEAREPSSMRRL